MKKIIIVSHSAGGGGSQRVAVLLANHLAKEGHDVTFYAIHSDKREYELDGRVYYTYVGTIKSPVKQFNQIIRAWRLKEYIQKMSFDVMISFVYLEGFLLIGNHSLKKIYSLRNDPTRFYSAGFFKKLLFSIYRDADYVVFQTPDARDYFDESIQRHGVLIENPIKQDLPVWNEKNHNDEIVAACRISKQKNLKMLIDAFQIVLQKNTKYSLAIYGEGELLEQLRMYVTEKGLNKYIEFRGQSSDIYEIMSNSALFVSSSDYEGISNSMLEAMAIGLPVVCTDCPVGGARMFIEDGKNGFLSPVNDAEQFAEKILIALDGKTNLHSISTQAQMVRQKLSDDVIYQKWIDIVE